MVWGAERIVAFSIVQASMKSSFALLPASLAVGPSRHHGQRPTSAAATEATLLMFGRGHLGEARDTTLQQEQQQRRQQQRWHSRSVSNVSRFFSPAASSCSMARTRLYSIGMGDCPSEEECEIVYDDDDEDDAGTATTLATEVGQAGLAAAASSAGDGDGGSDSGGGSDSLVGSEEEEDREERPKPPADTTEVESKGMGVEPDREGLEHREKVLDDGYQKQDMIKWRDAEVVGNEGASADDRCRLLTLSLVKREGLQHEFSRATWLENYKVPGQFVGIRLDEGGDSGVAGCIVAVSTEPTTVRQNGGNIQLLVTEEPTFRLKGDTRGPAEEAKGRSLATLEKGDRVKMSDFMGRGFASLFVGWIGLQSALQEKRDIVVIGSGARGWGSVKPVLDWPPVQAHACINKVSVFLESESPVAAPFRDDVGGWRSSGVRVTPCFTTETNENPLSVEAALFANRAGLAGAVGGNPVEASFLMAGLTGKRAMELTDRLTDGGVDPSRLLFNDFF